MPIKTSTTIKVLSDSAVKQLDIATAIEMLRDQFETHYEELSDQEFNTEWKRVFGE